ncbi:ArsR/SmtB family transcription factor [Paludibacterium yongneupense]|uniref:ArsR/SmtB family transcription factor n=1 Tax=Paludibacterium yongneupense TaxID=400061 RepID=UPI00041B3B94|nr:metalloregulator ArsR/SmtB family transcription factor [Paludibacterium yongneupense]
MINAACRKKAIDIILYFDKTGNMEISNAAELLAALGHESRLAIFRMLVEVGPSGMNASAIGERLALPLATLSFHLSHLSRVGLIKGKRESRFIHYSAEFGTMDDLIAFLTHNCCQGKACLPKTASCDSVARRRGDAIDREHDATN